MARPIKFVRQCCPILVVALIVIALGKTDGASIAVDRKEPNAETATPVNTTDPSASTEEKLDSRMMSAGYGYSGNSYAAGQDTGYGASSVPGSNYGSAYSGTGNYASGPSYPAAGSSSYSGVPNVAAYNTGYGSAYGSPVTQSPSYNTAYGSGSYGATAGSYGATAGSYGATAGSYGATAGSYGATPGAYGAGSYAGSAYGNMDSSYGGSSYAGAYQTPSAYGNNMGRPTYGAGSSYGVTPAYGNYIGSSYGNYGVTQSPFFNYGASNNLHGSSYGNYDAGYGAGSYYGSNNGYGGVAGSSYGVTSSPYSSYGGAAPASYGHNLYYNGMPNGVYGGSNSYSNVGAGYAGNKYPFGYAGNNVAY